MGILALQTCIRKLPHAHHQHHDVGVDHLYDGISFFFRTVVGSTSIIIVASIGDASNTLKSRTGQSVCNSHFGSPIGA